MPQQTTPLTPEQELQAAKILRAFGYLEALVMPWVMLPVFVFSGLAAYVPHAPYLVFEDQIFLYSLVGTMLMMLVSGIMVINISDKTEASALAKLQGKNGSSGPILQAKRGA